MKLILDTHIFLWGLSDPQRIAKEKRAEIESLANIVYVSSVCVVEMMIKASLGKLVIDFDPLEQITGSGFEMLDFSCQDAVALKDLPFHHRDPFDRMLIAQSKARGIPIVTDDRQFSLYDCQVI
ncbi:MAG: type II toxin-antitoxin system VapC family toxin [Verrucomicrobia bacterium]|jgi:PIN domain nuclease of toxin-antitoxin system|nr:type II toxin-antitoxin system VapC family toxin [Verrucomicrobiota bacterium]MDA1067038.1 type II toxin-antitoxin system VapC family toxin [Verrucomicrobiota bacterium]